MKSLPEHMGMYAAYHQNGVNRAIHFVMVPAIVWSLMVALDHVGFVLFGTPLSLAMVVTGALLLWYLMLDFSSGLAGMFVFTALLVSAMMLNNAVSVQSSLTIAGIVFVASWVFQFIGHGVWEKRRPALMDNLFQVLVAPLFLVAETAFAMGFKENVQSAVTREMQQHLR